MSGSEQLLLAPTPYIIGIPTSFLVIKRNVALPDDVWLVDLDEAKIFPPETNSEVRLILQGGPSAHRPWMC